MTRPARKSTLDPAGSMSTHPTLSASLISADGERLAAQMRPALVRYFKRKIGSPAEAEDLAQEVILRALTRADWRNPDQVKGYLFRTAVNCLNDRWRRLKARGEPVDWNEDTAEECGTQNPPECVLIVEEELHRLARALDGLPERTRTVLMLVRYEQMRIATVAEMLGLSLSAVNKDLAAAARHVARFRSREGSAP